MQVTQLECDSAQPAAAAQTSGTAQQGKQGRGSISLLGLLVAVIVAVLGAVFMLVQRSS